MATRTRRRPHCSICGKVGHNKSAHRNVKGRRVNPDFFRDRFGRPHPIRHTPDYEEGFPVPPRRSPYRDGPRGGYTYELPGRDMRAARAKERAKAPRAKTSSRRSGLSYYQKRDVAEAQFRPRRRSRLW